MSKYPFTDTTATDVGLWWNRQEGTGRLANYLLDPEDFFTDGLSKNLTRMAMAKTEGDITGSFCKKNLDLTVPQTSFSSQMLILPTIASGAT